MRNKKFEKLFKQKEKIEKKIKLLKFDEFLVWRKINAIVKGCKHYSYDSDAFEESCDLCLGGNDFYSSEACRFCKFWEAKKK
jgi:hypothetical protein